MLLVATMFHLQINASEIFNGEKAKDATASEVSSKVNDKSIIGREYEIGTVINSNEKMKWIVMDYDKDNQSKVLLVTKDIIDYREYHTGPTNYKNSKIRYYLNKEFYEKNFSADEKKHIILSNIQVKIGKADAEFEEGTPSQITLNDKIFLLSREEMKKYESLKKGNLTRNSYAELIGPADKEHRIWVRDILNYKEATFLKEDAFTSKSSDRHLGVVAAMWYDFSSAKSAENLSKEEKEYNAKLLLDRKGGKLKKFTYTDEEKAKTVIFTGIKTGMDYSQVLFGDYYKNSVMDTRLSWYVVDDDGKDLTLFLKNILEYMELEYDSYDKNVLKDNPYDHSNIKKYLNGELYEKLFTNEEKELISSTNGEKMSLPDVNDVFNYDLFNFDHTTGEYVINKNSRIFFNAQYKYSFFVNAPYEYNDNIYLMSLIDKNGTNLLSFNYSYNKDKSEEILTGSGIRPIVKVDKKKFEEYLKKQSLKLNTSNLNKKNSINIKLGFNQKIKFGKYEQDGNLKNGKEDIEWRVVKKSGDKYLLISDKVLDVIDLTNDIEIKFFEDSYAYSFANSEFIDEAFNDNEKSKLELVDNQYILYYDEVLKKYDEEDTPGMSFAKSSDSKVFNASTYFDLFFKNLIYEDVYKTENTKYVNEKCNGLDCYLLGDLAAYKTYNDMPFYASMKNDGNIDFGKKVVSGFRPLICVSGENLMK